MCVYTYIGLTRIQGSAISHGKRNRLRLLLRPPHGILAQLQLGRHQDEDLAVELFHSEHVVHSVMLAHTASAIASGSSSAPPTVFWRSSCLDAIRMKI